MGIVDRLQCGPGFPYGLTRLHPRSYHQVKDPADFILEVIFLNKLERDCTLRIGKSRGESLVNLSWGKNLLSYNPLLRINIPIPAELSRGRNQCNRI
jgi:hypothetical protein